MQEMKRREPGWVEEDDGDEGDFHWVSYQHKTQWRGCGIGISNTILEAVLGKRACGRGMAILVKCKNVGRVVFGTVHAPTGVTCNEYIRAIREVKDLLGGKWQQYPCVLGVDVNEEVRWGETDEGPNLCGGNANFQEFADVVHAMRLRPIAPVHSQRNNLTHFPLDAGRHGRQIDMLLVRNIKCSEVVIDADRRLSINSDHAALILSLTFCTSARRWGADSRARWVCADLPDEILVDWEDVSRLAREYTRPFQSQKYRDPEDVRDAFRKAKQCKTVAAWKAAHVARKAARRHWQHNRRARALAGDWGAYRDVKREKMRKVGWWGKLVEDRTDAELTAEVHAHLRSKLFDDGFSSWDDRLLAMIQNVPHPGDDWKSFTREDVSCVLSQMKAKSSVGPDMVGVDLLRKMITHETLGDQLVNLLNFHMKAGVVPELWDTSLLALLAKIDWPQTAKDLRPISMNSCLQKCLNKLAMLRAFPVIRRGSMCSGCGVGRQSADIIGSISRLRDVVREWKLPALLVKLDVKGAFDKVRRDRAAELIIARSANCGVDVEARWLLRQLACNRLNGIVPGGHHISVECNTGIKQGAPESAELFGILMGDILDELLDGVAWHHIPTPWGDAPATLAFYQDDVFIWEERADCLERRIELVAKSLAKLGLQLAEDKTLVIASRFYKGPRHIKIADQWVDIRDDHTQLRVLGVNFAFSDPPGSQAKHLLDRANTAARHHEDILREDGKWEDKATMINALVESTMVWAAGALHWNKEELSIANGIQVRCLRRAFRLARKTDEDWLSWHTRTWRHVRSWMHSHSVKRWSTHILELQFSLLGHWARQREGLVEGEHQPGIAFRMLQWRSHAWWKEQQKLSRGVGRRHPGCFYPDCLERRIAETVGLQWGDIAKDRLAWKGRCSEWIRTFDVKWSQGRQLSIGS